MCLLPICYTAPLRLKIWIEPRILKNRDIFSITDEIVKYNTLNNSFKHDNIKVYNFIANYVFKTFNIKNLKDLLFSSNKLKTEKDQYKSKANFRVFRT